jgi:hypothetical protein
MPGGSSTAGPGDGHAATLALVEELASAFVEHVRRATGFTLDGTAASLAVVDHHLRAASTEDRQPILALLSAEAGAYFGELVRGEIGGHWIGDGRDPRRFRLLLAPAFVWFAPVDVALDTLLAGREDAALLGGSDLDPAFHLHGEGKPDSDAAFVDAHLAELPAVPMDEYHSLTGRYETLLLVLEVLAHKHVAEGRAPATYGIADYLAALSEGV